MIRYDPGSFSSSSPFTSPSTVRIGLLSKIGVLYDICSLQSKDTDLFNKIPLSMSTYILDL